MTHVATCATVFSTLALSFLSRTRDKKDKAAVESAVEVVNKRVIGYLAEEAWTTVEALNAAIVDRIAEINTAIRLGPR